jgi:hypothetical protein
MLTTPVVTHHEARPYVALPAKVNMKDIPTQLPPLIPQVLAWLAQHNIAPSGAPFFLYLSIDQQNNLEARVGVPVSQPVEVLSPFIAGSFLSGDYLEITAMGNYDLLKDAHMTLEEWMRDKGLKERCPSIIDGSIAWQGGRTESYVKGAETTHNPDEFITDVFFLLD